MPIRLRCLAAGLAATLLGGLVVPGSPATASAPAASRVVSAREAAEPRVVQTQDPADGTALAVVATSAYRRDVFARSAQNTLLHRSYVGGRWSDWVDRGGSISSAPSATSWGAGRLDVFARGTDGRLWHLWFTDGAWSTWESFDAGLTSAPSVASWGPGRLDVFVRGGGNSLFHLYFDGGWSRWGNLGGGLTSAPTVAAWGPGRLDVFLRGGSNQLFQIFGDGRGTWSGWVNFGGNLESAPAVTSWGPERLDIVARGMHNTLLHQWFDRGWSESTPREGPLTSAPAVASGDIGGFDVFGLDGDGNVRQRTGPQPWGRGTHSSTRR